MNSGSQVITFDPRSESPASGPIGMTAKRDSRDFEKTVLRHLGGAYSLARWLMRSSPEAEDAVQDAMLPGLIYFRTFNGTNAGAWTRQIVRNTGLCGAAQAARCTRDELARHGRPEFEDACERQWPTPYLRADLTANGLPRPVAPRGSGRQPDRWHRSAGNMT